MGDRVRVQFPMLDTYFGMWPTTHQRLTQPSIPLGSVNEYQLWLHSISGWTWGVQVKLRSLVNVCHTWAPERCDHDKALYKCTFTFTYTDCRQHWPNFCWQSVQHFWILPLNKQPMVHDIQLTDGVSCHGGISSRECQLQCQGKL